MIEIKDSLNFFKIQSDFKRIPFSQSEGWYNYLKAQGKELVFYADQINNPNIMCWGVVERLPLSIMTILRMEGDVLKDIREKSIRSFYQGFKSLGYSGVEINNNHFYSIEYEVGLRRAGFIRPIGSFSSSLTIEVDLSEKLNFNRVWRKNLKNAVSQNLNFEEIENPTNEHINTFVELFNEMARFKKLTYKLSHTSILELLNSKDFRLFVVNDKNDITLSAHISYVKNGHAYAVFAANSRQSRNYGAAAFLYSEILNKLKFEQIKFFDHGRIPPSDKDKDGLYLFKRGTGGKIIQYNGEWTYYRSKLTNITVFFYKWLKLKKQLY